MRRMTGLITVVLLGAVACSDGGGVSTNAFVNNVNSVCTTMAASLEDGFRQVATSNEAKDLQVKATEVGEKVTSSKFFADLSSALTTGLRGLSDQLDKVASDLQTKNAQSGATPPPATPETGASDAKDIPISKE